MNWLSDNYKWLLDGVGGAALLGLIGWLLSRFFKEPAPLIADATLTARDSNVTSSPVTSGFGNMTTIVQVGTQPPAAPASPTPVPTMQDKPCPNIRQTDANVFQVNEFSPTRFIEDRTGRAQAVVIQFTNEARPDKPNAGVTVKASLVYESDNVGVLGIIGSWMYSDFDVKTFRVEDTHQLVVGILFDDTFTTIGMLNAGGYVRSNPQVVSAFQTVRVRLTNANNGDLLYEGRFRVTFSPLGIVPIDS